MKKINKILAVSLSILLAGNLVGCNKKEEPKTPEVLTTTTAEEQVTTSTKTKESRFKKTDKSLSSKTTTSDKKDKSKKTRKSTGTKKDTKNSSEQNHVKSTTKSTTKKTPTTTTRKVNTVVKPTTKSTTRDNTPKPLPTKAPTTTTTQAPTTTTTTLGLDPWEVDWNSGSLSSDLNNMRYIPGDKIFYAKDFGFDPNKAGEAAVEYMNNQLFDEDLWDVIDAENCSYYNLNGVNGNTVAYAVHIAKK